MPLTPAVAGTVAGLLLLLGSVTASAGTQRYEALSASVQANLSRAVRDGALESAFLESTEAKAWRAQMARPLARIHPDPEFREELLRTVYYEASRAGLEPNLVMALIEVESGFRKYAVSIAGARGFMQVMPFWVDVIGTRDHNLFQMRTNLRYGCTILRHYLDIERGDLFRALGRYNGSVGKPEYPTMVLAAWQNHWTPTNLDQADRSRSISVENRNTPG